jgi:predicted nucleotidyltransferase
MLADVISDQFPHLAELLGGRLLHARADEFQRLGMVPLWQVERDLKLLTRYVPLAEITSAYRDLLRNPRKFIEAMYEIRVAAMLAPFVDKLELAPEIGAGKCDLKCEVGGKGIFLEVTTRKDKFPPVYESESIAETPFYTRVTVEASFDPTTTRDNPGIRCIPASQELRQRIEEELRQLPSRELTVLVMGAPGEGRLEDMEDALWGDELIRSKRGLGLWTERVPNGLFCIPDNVGGTSSLSALVWMKLAPHFNDVRVRSRLFTNPLAACPLPPEAEEVLRGIFDRRALLLQELERIKRVLLEQYHPERIILFGSLARPKREPDYLHEWSDIDLAIVKSTPLGSMDRIREVMDLLQPNVGVNAFVYTPEEFARAEREGHFFVKDEILGKGRVLFP